MTLIYRIYQLFIALPILLVCTMLTCIITIIGSFIGGAHFWGYYPAKIWSMVMCRLLLLPIKIKGKENVDKKSSYVFVANHQGAFDIFLVYGFIGRNFKWMMKKSIRNIPLVGKACESARHIFVDKTGPKKIQETYNKAREILKEGTSLVVFPEGARSFTGHMGVFKRGAFQLADELQLPVVPVTINGPFDVLPRTKGFYFVNFHKLEMTIHQPIMPKGKGPENVKQTLEEAYEIVMSGLPKERQGFVENKDQ
ncbi:MAG: 1-acyl-sn-glycerol-3-phosphate acyltransferase [Paraprevotella sp.]|nr:1-acyl-sn-glycerol-3-phosphate acyltransferase [Paraprevotella sp.]MBQ8282665.1 1-acyl-sn-glycerol-3-phosphate acyltransferase [Paraprevotella sp.]MBR2380703.1 1-acyl-sn-glycerol-3-phosphate acyltransferase [Paraprevotella sp.]